MPIEPISEVHTAPIVLGLEHEQAIADLMRGRSLNAQSLSELVVRRSVSEEWLQQTGGLRTLLQLGRNSAKYNHYGDAAQHYISCLRILPREETIWENIIVALRHLPERDIKYYVITQLANISPDDAATWKKKAELAELLNLHRAAVAFYKQALDCNASDWHALDKVSSLLLRIGTPRFVQKPAPQPQYVPNAKPAPPPYAPAIPIAPAPPAAREEKTEEKPVDILQCPECGVTVGESDTKCPRCGAESEYGGGEEKPAAAPSQQEDWQNMERAVDKATYEALHCQTCGAFT
ncbi:MAG TPA: hypothetical protein VJB68_07175, partial [Methylophilaceae bacterium]|nr:hypothetical protein [Methylophilaceae bacterium]